MTLTLSETLKWSYIRYGLRSLLIKAGSNRYSQDRYHGIHSVFRWMVLKTCDHKIYDIVIPLVKFDIYF